MFYRYDVWSWGAEAFVAIVVLAVTAGMVGAYLRERTGGPARRRDARRRLDPLHRARDAARAAHPAGARPCRSLSLGFPAS